MNISKKNKHIFTYNVSCYGIENICKSVQIKGIWFRLLRNFSLFFLFVSVSRLKLNNSFFFKSQFLKFSRLRCVVLSNFVLRMLHLQLHTHQRQLYNKRKTLYSTTIMYGISLNVNYAIASSSSHCIMNPGVTDSIYAPLITWNKKSVSSNKCNR